MAELTNRYAAALFDLSIESGNLEEQVKQAVMVCNILQEDKCKDFLQHPHIPDIEKYKLLDNLFQDGIFDDLMGFLHLAVAKNRESLIVPTLTAYINMGKEHNGQITANVASAVALSDEQIDTLRITLAKKLNKEVKITYKVDPALIGGLYIHVDGRLIDCSVRSRLSNMIESIKRGGAE